MMSKELAFELEAERTATRKCLEKIPEPLFSWKPHETSMDMGYLVLLVSQLPLWVAYMAQGVDIDLATFPRYNPSTTRDLVNYFDENMEKAIKSLNSMKEEQLKADFSLKNNHQILYTSPRKESIISTINHMVHHRGQLTVYMRMNDIAVPSIYGPSADDKTF